MLFNSPEFLLFLVVVYAFYWWVNKGKLEVQNIILLIASYFFYGWWSYKFLGMLALSTFLDYLYGFWVASPNRKKAKLFLILGVVNNLGILAVFKYFNFFSEQFAFAFTSLGFTVNPIILNFAIPVGISFYTFHGMSYFFDIYRGERKPINSFTEYAVFVSFFPLLVAGPIERANHLLPQIQKRRSFNYKQSVEGAKLILWGLFKKVVVADNLARIVDGVFDGYPEASALTLMVGIIAFSFQIYGDFSGYTDIALGVAKLFGFELLTNFKFPYFSRDLAEFWRRWHISLSSWFRDYLYIPLGGSRGGKMLAVRNTFIVFVVSGFWHGASWNFIIWGFLHGLGFLPLLLANKNRKHVSEVVASKSMLPTPAEFFQMAGTFLFVTFAWIFFRAATLADSVGYIKRFFTSLAFDFGHAFKIESKVVFAFVFILPLLLGDWYLRHNDRELKVPRGLLIPISLILGVLVFFYFGSRNSFIYFQF